VTRWFLVPVDGRASCGSCRRPIAPGELVLVYLRARPLFRCSSCAGEPAPAAADVPPLPATTAEIRDWTGPV
jgi:hypothetical protein